jgi:DNA-binding transcriptional MerR regulator
MGFQNLISFMEFDKQYYLISEVAKFFQIKTSKIRYWETQFPHLSPQRRSSGIRKYTPSDIQKIQVIYDLIDKKGLTIEGARLAINNKGVPKNENTELINQLTEIRDFLQVIRNDLTE